MQSLVYPFLAFASWNSKKLPLSKFLECGWSDKEYMFFELLFTYTFFGYLTKDMWTLRNHSMFVAHHIACIISVFLALSMQKGVGLYVFLVTCLELGTLVYNLKCVFYGKFGTDLLYWVGMSSSNVVGSVIQLWYLFMITEVHIVIRLTSTVLLFGLVFGRQHEMVVHLKMALMKQEKN